MKSRALMVLLLVFVMVVAACAGEETAETTTTTTQAPATTQADGDGDGDGQTTTTTTEPSDELPPPDSPERTLVLAATGTPSGFDGDIFGPNMQNVVVNITEQLVDYAEGQSYPDGGREVDGTNVEGRLAESWTVSDDGLTAVFKLREGVLSHLGNELTAEDVIWSYEKSFSQGRTGNFIANVSNVADVEAISEYEVQFTLSAPSPIFLRAITIYTPSIYDSTEVKKHATDEDPFATEWLKSNFAGFGPYYLDELVSGQQAIFKANPNYYRGEPYFTTVIYQAVPEAANRVALLQAGQADVIEAPTQQQFADLLNDPAVKVQQVPGNLQARLMVNANFEPFDDVRVRQALIYALDADEIIKTAFLGIGEAARSPIPPSFPCYTGEHWPYSYDPAMAQQLLADAGYGDGIDLTLEYADVRPFDEALAVQAQAQWAEAGINVELKKIPNDEMFSRVATGTRDLPFFAFFEQSIVLDPGYSLFLTSLPNGAANRNDYFNQDFIDAVEEANRTLDDAARCALLSEAQRLHVEDATWTISVLAGGSLVMAPDITGWMWYPDNHPRWYQLSREG